MAFPINEYPYTDVHEMNMDYCLRAVRQIPELINNAVSEAINNLELSGDYDPITETLTITIAEVTP